MNKLKEIELVISFAFVLSIIFIAIAGIITLGHIDKSQDAIIKACTEQTK